MPVKIFYAWQSDRPNNLNRGLIRRALDQAVREVSSDPEIEDAERPDIRIDQDTQGVPGSPDIAATIFRKINESDIFVADLTFIPSAEEDRESPNPNVLVEYGYALKGMSDSRMIAVFNEAFGDPDDLPFDLRQKRCLTYSVSNDGDDENAQAERRSAREVLVSKLTAQLRTVVENLNPPEEPEVPAFVPVEPQNGIGVFLPEDAPLGVRQGFGLDEPEHQVSLRNGPCLFLRLIPTISSGELSVVEANDIAQDSLRPLAYRRASAINFMRNLFGGVCYTFPADDETIALTLSQVFRNKELWGIDFYHASRSVGEQEFNVLPTAAVEEILLDALGNFLSVARDNLQLPLPVKIIVGIDKIQGVRLAVDRNRFVERFAGPILVDNIVDEFEVHNSDEGSFSLLLPFFEKIYDEAGVARPDEAGPV